MTSTAAFCLKTTVICVKPRDLEEQAAATAPCDLTLPCGGSGGGDGGSGGGGGGSGGGGGAKYFNRCG